MRVRDEPHIRHIVRICGCSVFESETHHAQIQLFVSAFSKHFTYCTSQLMNVHPGCVNRMIGCCSQHLEQGALRANTIKDAPLPLQRVRAALRLIPGHNRLVFSIQKKHRKIYIGFPKGVDSSREIIKQCTGANINTQSHPRHTSTVTSYQFRQRFKHLRRNIINHIPALVLKYVSYGAAPRPRYTCNHQNLRFLLL